MRFTATLLFCFLFRLGSFGQHAIFEQSYTVNPVTRHDRTEMEITLTIKTAADTAILVKMPTDYYGTPDLHKYVARFDVLKGDVKERQVKELRIRPQQKLIQVKYILSYDPVLLSDYAFSPNTSPDHFHLAGCQWMLPVGDINDTTHFKIKIVPPRNWMLYSSLSSNAVSMNVRSTYRSLISSAIGGGKPANFRSFSIKGKRVSASVAGNFRIGKDSIFNALHKIVSSQRDWFNDFEQEFYHIAINPKAEVISGTSVNNLFVCFVNPEAGASELFNLFAHEMVHYWLPVKISFPGEASIRFEWLFEGFPEYIGRKVLLENNLITKDDLVEFINADLNKLSDNPYHAYTYEELAAQALKRYGSLEKKVSYYRGALIALYWDAKILSQFPGQSLKNVMVELNALSRVKKPLVPADLFQLLKKYGIDAESDFRQFILQGTEIDILLPSYIAGYELFTVRRPVFNLGFDILETRRNNVVAGVEENGPAWQVGLRNGVEVISYQNTSATWPFRNPVKIAVRDSSEKVHEYAYYPTGKTISVKQIRKAAAIK